MLKCCAVFRELVKFLSGILLIRLSLPLALRSLVIVIIDTWNPKTFSTEIIAVLEKNSKLVFNYHVEDKRLMEEYSNSSSYQSLQNNHFSYAYNQLHERTLAPILSNSRIRTWHYTRLLDDEVDAMHKQLVPSSLDYLQQRLSKLVAKDLLTQDDADAVFAHSPFHNQNRIRARQLCTTIIPVSHDDCGVEPLLDCWGGESAYFWLSDHPRIVTILKNIGTPRIIEIETNLTDKNNGFSVSDTVLKAWARQLGVQVTLSGCDLFVQECISTAKVMRIHTKGDGNFETVAKMYPENVGVLLA